MAAAYDPALAGVIDVVPPNGKGDKYGVFVGRHRLAAATLAGEKSMRCDVWPGGLTTPEKHRIKLGKDRDRRRNARIELFLNEVGAGEEMACNIFRVCEELGFEIGKCSAGKPYNRIEAVGTLQAIYRQERAHLGRVLTLNLLWRDEPKTNSGQWLGGLHVAVMEGWTDRISPSGYQRLKALIPAKVMRDAVALSTSYSTSKGTRTQVTYLTAERLRKAAGARAKPA
jgi:hypothetical protein